MRLLNALSAGLIVTLLACGTLFAQAWTEQQTTNESFNGRQPWVASFGTSEQQVVTANGWLQVNGVGGAGQFFTVNQKSQYQIATLTGVKSGSSWAGFGVTYYDSSWNEVGQQIKEINADTNNGGSLSRLAIGLVPPTNAAFAYVWIWNNNGGGFVRASDFKVVNYFPEGIFNYDSSAPSGSTYTQWLPSWRNRIINGNFETSRNAQNDDRYEGDEFWNVVGSDDSVYFASTGDFTSVVTGLRMGSKDEINLIYQTVGDLQPGQDYTFEIRAGRLQYYGANRRYVIAGIDFYDSSGNKIGDNSKSLEKIWSSGRYGSGPGLDVINFTTPYGTVRSVVWVWAEATGESDATVAISSLAIRPREYEPPQFELIRGLDVESAGRSFTALFEITDNYEVDTSTLDDSDFVAYRVGGGRLDIEVDISGSVFNPPDQYYYTTDAFTAADNGTYNIYYLNGEISDLSGNSLFLEDTFVGSFEVRIGN